jgi:hypothetical protein
MFRAGSDLVLGDITLYVTLYYVQFSLQPPKFHNETAQLVYCYYRLLMDGATCAVTGFDVHMVY